MRARCAQPALALLPESIRVAFQGAFAAEARGALTTALELYNVREGLWLACCWHALYLHRAYAVLWVPRGCAVHLLWVLNHSRELVRVSSCLVVL